jgi:hypothetical protein
MATPAAHTGELRDRPLSRWTRQVCAPLLALLWTNVLVLALPLPATLAMAQSVRAVAAEVACSIPSGSISGTGTGGWGPLYARGVSCALARRVGESAKCANRAADVGVPDHLVGRCVLNGVAWTCRHSPRWHYEESCTASRGRSVRYSDWGNAPGG